MKINNIRKDNGVMEEETKKNSNSGYVELTLEAVKEYCQTVEGKYPRIKDIAEIVAKMKTEKDDVVNGAYKAENVQPSVSRSVQKLIDAGKLAAVGSRYALNDMSFVRATKREQIKQGIEFAKKSVHTICDNTIAIKVGKNVGLAKQLFEEYLGIDVCYSVEIVGETIVIMLLDVENRKDLVEEIEKIVTEAYEEQHKEEPVKPKKLKLRDKNDD